MEHLERLESIFEKKETKITRTHTHRRTVYTYPDSWFAGCMMVRIYPAVGLACDGWFICLLVG